MKVKRTFILLLSLLVILAGCASNADYTSKETIGTVGGALGGGLLGSAFGSGSGRIWAVAIGAVAGGLIGKQVGKNLDSRDQQAMQSSAQSSLENNPSNQSNDWTNPDTGNNGTTTPVNTWYDDQGRPCRDYVQTVNHEGQQETINASACRDADGMWKVVQK